MPTVLETREAELRSIPPVAPPSGKSGWGGRAIVWSLALFAVLNLVLWNVDKDKQSNDVWHGTGSVDLAVNGLKNLPGRPGTVLLGSSLVMYPFWTMDRDRYGAIPDIMHHHDSRVLQEELKKAGFANPTVYSLAIFGQMVSDSYIFVDEYLKGDRKPEIVVYGIAPRDFNDSDLAGPMSTHTFKRLVGLENFGRYAELYLPGLQDKIDFVSSHVCFFYNKRWRLQHEFEKAINKLYKAFGLVAPGQTEQKANAQAGFMLAGTKDERWANSTIEYTRRYKNIADRDLSVQTGFLDRLLDLCGDREIKVIVVNMPLSADNRKLLPPGFYSQYRKKIAEISNRPGVKLLDLGESTEFTTSDFWDTVHLEHGGGYKLLKHLLPTMKALSAEKTAK